MNGLQKYYQNHGKIKIKYQDNAKMFVQNVMNKFCSAPWINMQLDTNGEIRPCCRYSQYDKQYKYKMPNIRDYNIEKIWNHKRMQNLRQAFIDGKQPDECVICWDEEEAGIQSFREKYNKKIPIDTTDIISDMPMMYDFKLNNIL